MLEGLVATLLNRFLGMYIQNFDPKQLNIGIWSGDVKLSNLELRREALDQMKLPLNVLQGHLGSLTIQIPWSNLKGKPVKVLIEDVYLLAAPKADQEYDEEEEERRRQRIKEEKLRSAELLNERNTAGMSEEEEKKNQSFTESLTTKIIDNVQVTVKNIHIRYEDAISTPGHPFALGLTLEEFSAISTNSNWEPAFVHENVTITHKLAKLGSLAVYWNTDASHFAGQATHDEVIQAFHTLIATGENTLPGHQFVLKPVSGLGRIEMSKTGGPEVPRMKAKLLFDEIGFVLDEDQYRDALMMVDLFHFYIRHQQYKKFQPKGVTVKQDPRAWFRFAGNAVLSQIHEKNYRWSWPYFEERRDDRKRYIELFKKTKKDSIQPAESEELRKLEWKLSYEDLRFYRSLARNQLKKEKALVPKKVEAAPQPQGWGSWLWGTAAPVKKEEEEEPTVMTEEQRKELYEAIDWDEKKIIAEAVDLPRETVKVQVEASLQTGSFTLRRDPHGQQAEILQLLFDTFKANFLQRPDSFYGEISLGGFRVFDGTTPGSLYPQIVRMKDNIPDVSRIEELDEEKLALATSPTSEEPFFHATFEQNPLDESADSALTAKMKSMEIIYNPRFVEEIVKFFKPPERHMESIGALLESAGATVEGIRQQTRAGLEYALEEHKTINTKLDLQAPLIIIPESCTQKISNCLIIDAGRITILSDLVKKDLVRDVQSKQSKSYTDEDYATLESLMYDKFKLTLHSTQVLIGPSMEETLRQLSANNTQKHLHIVDRINIDFTLQISIVPKAPNLTKFKISGHLPVLQANISDRKYKALMKIIDIAIPKLDTDDDDEPPAPQKMVRQPTQELAPPSYPDVSGPSAFKLSPKEDLVAPDESEDGEDETFEEASDGVSDTAPSVQQKTFEFKFTVDRLQGSLSRSDPDGGEKEKELATVIAEHFQLDFYVRQYEMAAEVVLKSFNIEDLVDENPSADFRKIVTSDGVSIDADKPLIYVKYVKVNPLSPDFMTIYEAIETNVDVSISTINVIITQKTILTLLDFILTTFTNPDVQPQATPLSVEGSPIEEGPSPNVQAPENKIRVKVDLKSIILILNYDGIRLATLSLNSADVAIFLRGKSMRLGARLGNVTLVDDVNEGAAVDSPLRQLVSIQGDELADFRYETFDPDSPTSYPGYNSSIYLRSGSVKVNFVEEPFRKIIDFAVKFGQMQALFNAARLAAMNQASQIQNPDKIHFDIIVRTPIIVFPRVSDTGEPTSDSLTAYLGEIYAQNKFLPLDEARTSHIVNNISTGIRKTRLTSEFNYEEGETEVLELLDELDLEFAITYMEHQDGIERPDVEARGDMGDINVKLTQTQYQFLMQLSKSIPAVFAGERDEEDAINDFQATMPSIPEAEETEDEQPSSNDTPAADLRPELRPAPGTWTKLDLVFKVGQVGLELFESEADKPVGNLPAASLSRAYLDKTNVKLRMISDGSLESELLIDSFNIKDSRKSGTNKFRNIVSSTNTNGSQFMASVRISGGAERNLVALLTIDSPRVVFALDYIFALKDFVMEGLAQPKTPTPLEIELDSDSDSDESISNIDAIATSQKKAQSQKTQAKQATQTSGPPMKISYRVHVVDSQVMLIANPSSSSSEAIVLGTKQIVLSQQNALTLQVSKVGMFLCRMDKFEENRLRVLDDFTLQVSVDNRDLGPLNTMTSIAVNIEPLVLRVSLRDILLATQIMAKASEMSQPKEKAPDTTMKATPIKGKRRPSTKRAPTDRVSSAVKRKAKSLTTAKSSTKSSGQTSTPTAAVVRREELNADIAGMRVIIIGDTHELPLLDVSIKQFTARLRDWTGEMTADTSIETFVNIYNFSKSAWEPLIEPWQLGFHMRRTQNPDKLSIDFFSRKMLEITVTSQTIALAMKAAQFIKNDEDMLTKPRGADAPYRIRNQTGYDLHVWAVTELLLDVEQMAVKLEDGEEAPWRFEEWEKMRENLTPEGTSGIVGIKLENSSFDSIKEIPVNKEGETLYLLRPAKNDVLHRLLCEVHLGADNVKYITFRSPMLLSNNTQIPIELGMLDNEMRNITKIYKIAPGESQPAPIEFAYTQKFLVRPDPGFGFDWSQDKLFWKDLVQKPTRSFVCRSTEPQNTTPFCFHMHANIPKAAVSNSYPYMKISLSAPLEVQNLLPYDFKFRIYDKNTKKEWANFLRKGGLSPVHVVELSHLLLLSIDMQDTVFNRSEFSIINTNSTEYDREHEVTCVDNQRLELSLKLHYFPIPESGGAFRVSVYSPYVILNKTGMDVLVKSKSLMQSARAAAGQVQSGAGQKPTPYMFSFPSEERQNRAVLKVGDSNWSRPQSFEAIGSSSEVVLTSAAKPNEEIHIGIFVEEGRGKHRMSKIITLTPRFIIKSRLSEEINVREWASSSFMALKPGALLPLHFLKAGSQKQLCLSFPGTNNTWTAPFNISNLGSVHLKINKANQRQKLLRVDILAEQSTIFLHISMETKSWPFSIRNESHCEFTFFQSDPYEDDDEAQNGAPWKPIRYRLPARSIMPYAWDFPAAKKKELVISANGRERHVRLAEIGNLLPLKVPGQDGEVLTIDINVTAEGPTQTLVLSDYKESKSMYKPKHNESHSSLSTTQGFEVIDNDSGVTFRTQFRFAGIGVSLINTKLKELAYITCRDMEFTYTESSLYQTLNLMVKWIQIDNQLYGGIFPIVLYPSVVQKTGQEMEVHPSLHASIMRVKDDSYGVIYIKYATFLLQQMTLELDEDFIYALLDFTKIPGAAWEKEDDEAPLCDESLDVPEPKLTEAEKDLYFEVLNLQPMQIDLSFVRTDVINVEDQRSSHNPIMFLVNVLTMAFGNVNDAPIRLRSLMVENARVSLPVLSQLVQTHYSQQALGQVHKILGSADFLGNPVGLFNNISSGVMDIFYEPYQGLIMTDRPQELGIGIAKGATSFVKKSVFGVSDSLSKFTGSISKGLTAATLDKQFQDKRRMSKARNRPKHALYGVTQGATSLASSFADGFTGLARQPIQGGQREGALGFFKGIGKGVVGLATKPAIGIFDLASNVTEGIRNTTTVFDAEGLDRVRLTRFIGQDGIVRPYSQREALGQFWLKQLDNGKYFNEEYIAHLDLPEHDSIVMLTYKRIMMVKSKNLSCEWDISLQQVKTITMEKTGILLYLRGNNQGPFIPTVDETARQFLFKKIALAVNSFNSTAAGM
ncbi:hypothetical protein DFH27DRAFT_185031 [Peziza echinospora]|nr:hypothetical protein DFH27DRAFT_185031 [Peziza echinospora]